MQHRHLYNCVSFDDISTFFASDCVSSNSRHNQSLFSAFLIFSFSPLPSVRRRSSGTAHFSKMEFFFISHSACLLLTLWIAYRLCAISSLAQAVSDTPWLLCERMKLRDEVKTTCPDCKIALIVDSNTEKQAAKDIRDAKKNGIIDQFFYGSMTAEYLMDQIYAM